MRGLLIVNPRAGRGGPTTAELATEARRRGIDVHVLEPGDDATAIARAAEAEALGVAGGDGSLGRVAQACVERGLPFVCVPLGTRNHFARDVGLDLDRAVTALDAFAHGRERRIDVGRVNGRVFLNNVSLGLYARLVHNREDAPDRRDALARVRAFGLLLGDWHPLGLTIDGAPFTTRVVVVSNNAYTLELFSIGERERLDEGLLHVYVPSGLLPGDWLERTATELTIGSTRPLRAAIDGEPDELATPIELSIDPGALRLLVPADA